MPWKVRCYATVKMFELMNEGIRAPPSARAVYKYIMAQSWSPFYVSAELGHRKMGNESIKGLTTIQDFCTGFSLSHVQINYLNY